MHNKKDAQKKIEGAGKRGMKKIIISSICAFLGAICIIGLLILLWNIKIGQRGDEFGRVMSMEEICTRINYARRNIHKRCLDYNYKKQCTDFYNIDLTRNNIANRTTRSWYEEQYTNNKESLITITFSVVGNILWFEIEEKGGKKISSKEYELMLAIYKEFTHGNIDKKQIDMILDNKKNIGEYRIDSDDYPDVFKYVVTKKGQFIYYLAGIMK